ncbi:Cilia- and flagella-associated protein 54, partial [Camelus dromedarius]
FIKTLDVEKRFNCCLLSALLFQMQFLALYFHFFHLQGLLRTTLPHPKAERCYAQYEITQLLPGIELFSDRYRADICSVVASLYYIIRELHFAKQNLIVKVLIDLGFFSEAFHEISQIFYGKSMPSSQPTGCKATGKMKFFQSFDSGKPLTSKENLQSVLLTEAEDRLNSLISEMEPPGHKNLSQCSAGELEIVVEARLQLAAVALQRHRAAYSAAIVFSTLKLLHDSKLFKTKVVEDDTEDSVSLGTSANENKDDTEFLDPVSLNSREYFNIHLWLRCRLALVTAFVAQIRGIGIMKENDITDYVSLINEVCVEAKSVGDRELQAEFLMQAVIIGLQEKHLKADIIKNLQDIIHLLEEREFISPRSHLTLVRSMLLLDDLTKAEKFKETPSLKTEKLYLLTQSHNILIEQMLTFGETIEFPSSNTDYASPLLPLKNIYLPHVMLLAKTKMRIGHTVAKQVYYTSKKKDPSKWLPALHLFEIALKLSKTSGTEEHEVEAEIFFQKGKIEIQILMDKKSPTLQLESLFEAIQLSLRHDQNSG